ncbi:hypothetical protein ACJX0J_007617, partial [Zea mays]
TLFFLLNEFPFLHAKYNEDFMVFYVLEMMVGVDMRWKIIMFSNYILIISIHPFQTQINMQSHGFKIEYTFIFFYIFHIFLLFLFHIVEGPLGWVKTCLVPRVLEKTHQGESIQMNGVYVLSHLLLHESIDLWLDDRHTGNRD